MQQALGSLRVRRRGTWKTPTNARRSKPSTSPLSGAVARRRRCGEGSSRRSPPHGAPCSRSPIRPTRASHTTGAFQRTATRRRRCGRRASAPGGAATTRSPANHPTTPCLCRRRGRRGYPPGDPAEPRAVTAASAGAIHPSPRRRCSRHPRRRLPRRSPRRRRRRRHRR